MNSGIDGYLDNIDETLWKLNLLSIDEYWDDYFLSDLIVYWKEE